MAVRNTSRECTIVASNVPMLMTSHAITRWRVSSESTPKCSTIFPAKSFRRMATAGWYVLSARKAEDLLKKLFWERVYALRERGFAQNYKNAEVDMHFSISTEMTPLKDFLRTYKEGDQGLLMSRLAKGVF